MPGVGSSAVGLGNYRLVVGGLWDCRLVVGGSVFCKLVVGELEVVCVSGAIGLLVIGRLVGRLVVYE